MKIILFTHSGFQVSQSMPRYAKMLSEGMEKRGHQVECWTAKTFLYKIPSPKSLKKWFGYVDQFLIFPFWVKFKLRRISKDTIFVFADHALGPWVPLVSNRKHVIHCHDFLAQKSALGLILENKVSKSGKFYQSFIRKGYQKGMNFISISKKTQKDLHQFLNTPPLKTEVVYNGLNQNFSPSDDFPGLRGELSLQLNMDLDNGYILHVGGNQFYKNKKGVLEIYLEWRNNFQNSLPLILIGPPANRNLKSLRSSSSFGADIYFLTGIKDDILKKLYQGASVLLYPSIAEGFGWPIAEAQASGCPVITTNEAPMNEVGGEAAFYIDLRPSESTQVSDWAINSAQVLENLLNLKTGERKNLIEKGLENAKRFNTDRSLDQIESIYQLILNS